MQKKEAMKNNSDKAFALFGRIMIIALIVGILVFGGYYFGTHSSKAPTPTPVLSAIPSVTVPPTATLVATVSPTAIPSATVPPTQASSPIPQSRKVNAGKKGAIFTSYTVTVPSSSWTDTHTTTSADVLTMTKGAYVLTITQAAAGAGRCIFPGETPQPMAQVFTKFIGITGTSAQFRRGEMDATQFTICEQKGSLFSFPTSFGYITYTTPSLPDANTMAEMDGMVASLVASPLPA